MKTGVLIRRRILLLAALISWVLPATIQAQFTFVTNNGAITIAGYTGTGGAVIIPSATCHDHRCLGVFIHQYQQHYHSR
jgi:hypothetical protein